MSLTLPNTAIDTTVFPESYRHARDRWLKAATALPCAADWHNYTCPDTGPDGEILYTGTLWIGSHDASRVLVLTSATHGIEGFAGSAVQFDTMELVRRGALTLSENTAVLVVHALNPWGYAWQRRCDADGIDLNRNFVDFAAPLPENPGYDALRNALFCPDAAQRRQIFKARLRDYGRENFETAVSGGQYNDPPGPFYGGRKPAHGREVLEQLMQNYNLPGRRLAVIDLHTGLGPYGYGEIICDHLPDSGGAATARRWYGDAVTLPLLGTSSSVPKTGLIDYAWHAVMDEQSCFVTLEFGTYDTESLFDVILQDHRIWAEDSSEAQKAEHRRTMRRHFCPVDQAWRELVLFRARQVVVQALNGLCA